MRKIKGSDAGTAYAMKVLKKATLKGDFKLYLVMPSVTATIIDHPRSSVVYNFGVSVSLYVCVSVCLSDDNIRNP